MSEQPPLVDWTLVPNPDSERCLQRVFVHPDHLPAALVGTVSKLPDERGWHVLVAEYPATGFVIGNSRLPTADDAMQWAEVTVAVMWDHRAEWADIARSNLPAHQVADDIRTRMRAEIADLWREAYNRPLDGSAPITAHEEDD